MLKSGYDAVNFYIIIYYLLLLFENTEKTSETSVVQTYSFFHKTFDTTKTITAFLTVLLYGYIVRRI